MSVSGAGKSGGGSSPSPSRNSSPSPSRESRPSPSRDSEGPSRAPSAERSAPANPGAEDRSPTPTPSEVADTSPSLDIAGLDTEPEATASDPAASLDVVGEQADVASELTDGPSLPELDETAPAEITGAAEQQILDDIGLELPEGTDIRTEVVTRPEGQEQTVLSYEVGDTSYTRTLYSEDGVDFDTTQAQTGDTIETTAIERRMLEGPIEGQLPEGADFGFTLDGERGPLEETRTRVTVAEGDQESTILESTTYEQHIPFSDDPLGDLVTSTHAQEIHSGRQAADAILEQNSHIDLDFENSGQTLSFTEITTPGDDGTPQVVQEQSSAFRVEGELSPGETAVFDHELTWQSLNGERTGGQLVVERDGWTDIGSASAPFDVPGFHERLGDPSDPLRSRTTLSLHPETGNAVERITEWGDYDVEGDASRFIMREGGAVEGPSPSLTYERVSNGGLTYDGQTIYPGTEISSRTHAQYAENGTYSSQTTVRDGDELLSRQTHERQIVSAEQVEGALSPELSAAFLGSHTDGSIFQDHSTFEDFGTGTTEETRAFSSESGVLSVGLTNNADGDEISVVRDAETGLSVVTTPDGQFSSFDGGETFAHAEAEAVSEFLSSVQGAAEQPSELRSQASAFNRLNKAASVIARETSNPLGVRNLGIPSEVGANLDRAGVAFAGLAIADAISQGDPVAALQASASGTTAFAGVTRQLQGLLRPNSIPSGAAPSYTTGLQGGVLRAGGVLSAGLAVYDLTQGNYRSAALNGATAVGLALIAAPEPITSAAGLVIVSGATIYSLGELAYHVATTEAPQLPEWEF